MRALAVGNLIAAEQGAFPFFASALFEPIRLQSAQT